MAAAATTNKASAWSRALGPVQRQLAAYSSRGVSDKLDRFLDCYALDGIQCHAVATDSTTKVVLSGREQFTQRYGTCFEKSVAKEGEEASAHLDAWVGRRFRFTVPTSDDKDKAPFFFADCETYRNLIKPVGGALDGSTGLSEPGGGDIVVLWVLSRWE